MACTSGTTFLGIARNQTWPCDAARLLQHFAPVPRSPGPGIFGGSLMFDRVSYGLLGPATTEELSK